MVVSVDVVVDNPCGLLTDEVVCLVVFSGVVATVGVVNSGFVVVIDVGVVCAGVVGDC